MLSHPFRKNAFYLLATAATLSLLVITPAQEANALDLKVGGIGIVKPTYEGSDRYEVIGAPIIFPSFGNATGGALTVNGPDDVRLRAIKRDGFEAGVLAGYDFGRDESDGPLLGGLGDVDAGFIVGGFMAYRFGSAYADVSYHHVVSGDDTGGFLRAGLTTEHRLSAAFKVKARISTTYATDDYLSSRFGVTAAQAATSTAGLSAYNADAGFKDVAIGLSGTYDLSERWTLMTGVGYKRLIGDAADSPVVETADQFSASLALTYRFTFNR